MKQYSKVEFSLKNISLCFFLIFTAIQRNKKHFLLSTVKGPPNLIMLIISTNNTSAMPLQLSFLLWILFLALFSKCQIAEHLTATSKMSQLWENKMNCFCYTLFVHCLWFEARIIFSFCPETACTRHGCWDTFCQHSLPDSNKRQFAWSSSKKKTDLKGVLPMSEKSNLKHLWMQVCAKENMIPGKPDRMIPPNKNIAPFAISEWNAPGNMAVLQVIV